MPTTFDMSFHKNLNIQKKCFKLYIYVTLYTEVRDFERFFDLKKKCLTINLVPNESTLNLNILMSKSPLNTYLIILGSLRKMYKYIG